MLSVAILSGGLATRLRPLTETIPKSLVEVAGEPFLAHQLRLLAAHGLTDIVLCTGHLGEMIEQFAGDGARFGVRLRYSSDGDHLLGTGGAIKRALPLLGDVFYTLYGDSYLTCDYQAVGRQFLATGALALMTVFRNNEQWDSSNVEFRDGRILAYSKKERTPRMRHIDYGLGVFHCHAFDRVPEGEVYDLAALYQSLLAEGRLAAFEVHERFYETGSFAGIQELESLLAGSR